MRCRLSQRQRAQRLHRIEKVVHADVADQAEKIVDRFFQSLCRFIDTVDLRDEQIEHKGSIVRERNARRGFVHRSVFIQQRGEHPDHFRRIDIPGHSLQVRHRKRVEDIGLRVLDERGQALQNIRAVVLVIYVNVVAEDVHVRADVRRFRRSVVLYAPRDVQAHIDARFRFGKKDLALNRLRVIRRHLRFGICVIHPTGIYRGFRVYRNLYALGRSKLFQRFGDILRA